MEAHCGYREGRSSLVLVCYYLRALSTRHTLPYRLDSPKSRQVILPGCWLPSLKPTEEPVDEVLPRPVGTKPFVDRRAVVLMRQGSRPSLPRISSNLTAFRQVSISTHTTSICPTTRVPLEQLTSKPLIHLENAPYHPHHHVGDVSRRHWLASSIVLES